MKQILMLSIIFQLLCFTVKSQSITVKENKLCFDSAAAVQLYKTIVDRESFAQEIDIYQETLANYDTAFKKQEELIVLQKVLTYEAEKKYQAEKNDHQETKTENKRQKRKSFWIGTTTGLSLPLILMILIK